MNKNHPLANWIKTSSPIAILILFSALNITVYANDLDYRIGLEDVIASAHTNSLENFQKTAIGFTDERKKIIAELLDVLKNTSSLSANLNQSAAAYYLGEMHASQSVDVLALKVTLQFDMSHFSIHGFPIISGYPAMDALIKIGNPSLPAVIRNLAESDDAKVRELSLQVLVRIDNDKDISQLRLEKALKAEKDAPKQARLQVALKALEK